MKDLPPVIEGVELACVTNTDQAQRLANIQGAIRRHLPQVQPCPPQPQRICLLGGGPSLNETIEELRDLVFDGALVVTTNGAYRWAVEHNFRPSAQIILDARACNASFLDPPVPNCQYFLASHCDPSTFDAVAGRTGVAIYHAVAGDREAVEAVLKEYYVGRYHTIGGGSTVVLRALAVLRTIGYFRFDLFGVDSCWLDGQHHAFDQPQNATDRRVRLDVNPVGHPELRREFWVSPWHIKQLEDFLEMRRHQAAQFQITVHGPGLIAYALAHAGDVDVAVEDDGPLSGESTAAA